MNNTGIIILAAGRSSRLGRPKQLLPWKGKPLVVHAAEEALQAGLSPVVVVTGAYAEPVGEVLAGMEIRVVWNAAWEEGMASSIVVGLEMVGSVDAVILAVCDQPFISAALFEELIGRRIETGRPVVASVYGDSVGTPVLFAAELFPELLALKGDVGAKKVILRHAYAGVDFPAGSFDVDTEEGYRALLSGHGFSATGEE